MRQRSTGRHDPRPGVSVATLARDYPRDAEISRHTHASDQLIYASRGIMTISSGSSSWTIPPQFGLWIPARTSHRLRMSGEVSMRTLYLRPRLTRLERRCAVLHVAPLLRELIIEIVRLGELRLRNRVERALRELLVAELNRASPMPTLVVLPSDARALAVARAVLEKPGSLDSLRSLSAAAHASVRTIERAFRKDLGTSFEAWRMQVRLTKGIELLVAGRTVKEVAFLVGYQHPSAFVARFRATFGTTPKAWINALTAVGGQAQLPGRVIR